MKQLTIVTILIIMLLTACSANTPNKTQYYLLNSPTNITSLVQNNESQQNVSIKLLALPEYLKQPSLVLQLSSHQLHYSHFHMWAEPLQSSFSQALIEDLNQKDKRFHYINSINTPQKTPTNTINVSITAFHATHLSQALLTGTFWQENTSATEHQTNNFAIALPLNQNGYEHAVEQMRKSISQLAEKIIDTPITE